VHQNPYAQHVGLRLEWRQLWRSYFFTALVLGQPAPVLLLEAVGVGFALQRGGRQLRFLLAPLAIAFLLLTFLRIGPHEWWRHSRYLVTIAPGLALLAGGGFEEATRRFPRLAPALLLLAAAARGTRVLLLERRPPLDHAAAWVIASSVVAVSLAALLWRLRDRIPAHVAIALLLAVPLVTAPAGAFAGHRPTPAELQAADAATWLAGRGAALGPVMHDVPGLEAACAGRVGEPCPLVLREAQERPPGDVQVIVRQFLDGAAVASAPQGWRETWRRAGERIRGPLSRPRTCRTVTIAWERD
jgi:hypothetical protein